MLVDKHPIGIILKSNPVKSIRFSVNKKHWNENTLGRAAFARLPDSVIGEIQAWGGRSKDDNKINVEWESDGTNSDECSHTLMRSCAYHVHTCFVAYALATLARRFLSVLLQPSKEFTLLPYARGNKTAPKAKGASAKRAFTTAMTTGPYAPAERAADGTEQTEVQYG